MTLIVARIACKILARLLSLVLLRTLLGRRRILRHAVRSGWDTNDQRLGRSPLGRADVGVLEVLVILIRPVDLAVLCGNIPPCLQEIPPRRKIFSFPIFTLSTL
jgi:hypothetical protein